MILVSLIFAIVLEFILSKNVYTAFSIGRLVALFGIISFIGIHFLIGFKKLYTYIIENRFLLSIVMIIFSTILGFMQKNVGFKEWIFSNNIVLSPIWNLEFYALLLVSYELFLIITKGKKYSSLIGSIVVAFSGAVQLNFSNLSIVLVLGELSVVIFDKLITAEKKKNLFSVIFIALGALYSIVSKMYAMSFAYIFLALIIWIILKNKNVLKNKDVLFKVVVTSTTNIVISTLLFKFVNFNVNYTIENVSGLSYIFSYLYNFLLPFKNINEKELFGSFISLFPIPMLVSLYYLYKYEKHAEFLLPITIITILQTVFCLSGFSETIDEIIGFNFIDVPRAVIAVNLANVYILFYMISNIEERVFSLKKSITLTLITVCLLVFVPLPIAISNKVYLSVLSGELCVLALLFYNFADSRYKNVLLTTLVILTLITGVFLNPIVKGDKKVKQIEKNSQYEELQC